MNKISFYEFGIHYKLKHKRDIKVFLKSIFKRENRELDWVNIIFCTDKYLLLLNRNYLNHDYYTDTVSFLLSKPGQPVVGEAYLSVERIKSNADQRHISFQEELIRVIIHSCLHLCGYSDTSQKDRKVMETLQENYLNKWFVSRETQIGR